MQGAILLIAARRADQISSELAAHDYAADTDSEMLITEVRALVRSIHHHVGAPRLVGVPPHERLDPRRQTGGVGARRLEAGRRPPRRELMGGADAVHG